MSITDSSRTRLSALAAEVADGVAQAHAALAEDNEINRALSHVARASNATIAMAELVAQSRDLPSPGGRATFAALEDAGLIPTEARVKLATLAGFRNLATKQCSPMDLQMIEHAIRTELGALTDFAQTIQTKA